MTKTKSTQKGVLLIKDIEEQRENMQNDIMCILEGIENKTLDNVCEVIVDRCNILISKLEGKNDKNKK